MINARKTDKKIREAGVKTFTRRWGLEWKINFFFVGVTWSDTSTSIVTYLKHKKIQIYKNINQSY